MSVTVRTSRRLCRLRPGWRCRPAQTWREPTSSLREATGSVARWPSDPTSVRRRARRTSCRPSRPAGRRCSPRSPSVAGRYGYGLIQSPMFEDIGVFQRIGEGTDVVAKEMYDFEDKGGRRIALRPEGTAPVARAFVEHRPDVPWKVWYATPAFRYERPQAGRLPPAPPGRRRVHRLGRPRRRRRGHRPRARLPVGARPAAVAAGRELHGHAGRPGRLRRRCCRSGCASASATSRPTTPPRSSRTRCGCSTRSAPKTRAVLADAPRMVDHLDAASVAHGERVQAGLKLLGIAVRGRRDARPRPRLLHAHALRVPELGARATPSRRSSAAAATTASSSSSAARPRPASASAAASSGCCSPATPRACSPRPSRRSTASWSTSPAARSPPRSCQVLRDGRRRDRPRLRRPEHEGADEGGRQERRPRRGHRRRATRRPAGTVTIRDLDGGRADRPSTSRPRSTTSGRCWTRDRARCAPTCAASCAPSTRASRSRCAAGSAGGASTASTSRSSTCATTPASCSAWSTAPTTCAASTSSASPAPCAPGPRAPPTTRWPPARSRSATARSRCCRPPSRRRSRSTSGPTTSTR